MAIRRILVPMDDSPAAAAALETAVLLARDLVSHVDAVHVRPDPRDAVPLLGEGMSGTMIEEMIDLTEREGAERAARARALFESWCVDHAVPVLEGPPAPDELSAGWIETTGREDEVLVHLGRLADLVVIGRPAADAEASRLLTINAVLFETGRPALVSPPQAPSALGRTVAIAWNGSLEAARAVAAAMPLVARAGTIAVLTAESDRTPAAVAADLATYFAWHGITAATRIVDIGGRAAGAALLAACGEVGADLLVMGAYTHSRLRQLIMGGVTRHVLSEATIPVLMAH